MKKLTTVEKKLGALEAGKFVVPSIFVSQTRELLQQTASVLDFVDGLEYEDMPPMLTQSLFEVLRTRLAPAQEELAKLCGENGRKA
jgi:hypothetical protein